MEISKRAQDLIRKYGATYQKETDSSRYHAENLKKYIAMLEAENERGKWQEGHPNDNRTVWICREDSHGDITYESNRWNVGDDRWDYYYGVKILGWKEIRSFDLEVGE